MKLEGHTKLVGGSIESLSIRQATKLESDPILNELVVYNGSIRRADPNNTDEGGWSVIPTRPIPPGQIEFTSPGIYTFTVPPGVSRLNGVAVGGAGGPNIYYGSNPYGSGSYWAGGGAGGGGLGYRNYIEVEPGEELEVVVGDHGSSGSYNRDGGNGEDSYLRRALTNEILLLGGGGNGAPENASSSGSGALGGLGGKNALSVNDGGGNGGNGANGRAGNGRGGSGGAGGYSGNGGFGGTDYSDGSSGSGGAGSGSSGAYSQAGGGVGLYGEGVNGARANKAGHRGSDPSGNAYVKTSNFGGGGYGPGAIRLIWGDGRAFPYTLTEDITE